MYGQVAIVVVPIDVEGECLPNDERFVSLQAWFDVVVFRKGMLSGLGLKYCGLRKCCENLHLGDFTIQIKCLPRIPRLKRLYLPSISKRLPK